MAINMLTPPIIKYDPEEDIQAWMVLGVGMHFSWTNQRSPRKYFLRNRFMGWSRKTSRMRHRHMLRNKSRRWSRKTSRMGYRNRSRRSRQRRKYWCLMRRLESRSRMIVTMRSLRTDENDVSEEEVMAVMKRMI